MPGTMFKIWNTHYEYLYEYKYSIWWLIISYDHINESENLKLLKKNTYYVSINIQKILSIL
jgi:hypothetical protein